MIGPVRPTRSAAWTRTPGLPRLPRPLGTVAVVLLLVALPLAGCVGGGGTGAAADGAPSAGGNGSAPTGEAGSLNATEADAKPHVHDRWDGATEQVLFGGTVSSGGATDADPQDPAITVVGDAMFNSADVQFGLPEGEIVPPGTDRLVVTASWDDGTPGDLTEGELNYRAANSAEWTELEDRTSKANWTIDVTVEMADDGHAEFSLWEFRVDFVTQAQGIGVTRIGQTSVEVDVEVVAERAPGPLPVEPPHPDWWGNGSALPIHEGEGSAEAVGVWYEQVGTDGSFFPAGDYLGQEDHPIVPPGTRTLVAVLNWTNGSPTQGTPAGVEPDVQWNNGYWFEWTVWEPTATEEGRWVYVLPVTPEMTDGMYAGRSRWQFRYGFFGEDPGVDEPVFGSDARGPYHFDGAWGIAITAYDVAEPPVG